MCQKLHDNVVEDNSDSDNHIEDDSNISKAYINLEESRCKDEEINEKYKYVVMLWEKVKAYSRDIIKVFLFPLLIVFYELIFHLLIFRSVDGLLFPILFSIPIGLVLCFINSFFTGKAGKISLIISACCIFLIFVTQYIYFDIFKTFLSFYSIGAVGTDALDYVNVLFSTIGSNLLVLLLFILPIVGIIYYIITKYIANKEKGLWRVIVLLTSTILYTFIIFILPIKGRSLYSPYDLYHKTWVYDMATKELGLLTATSKNTMNLIVRQNDLDVLAELPSNHNTYLESDTVIGKDNKINDDMWVDVNNKDNSSKSEEIKSDEPTIDNKKSPIEATQTPTKVPTMAPTPIPIDTSPNVLDIDFTLLAENEKKKNIQTLHNYFNSATPTNKNEYTGMFEGYNLIMLTAEGFSPYAVRKDVTPTLYQLVNSGFVFTEFYTPLWWASTIDGEYAACLGLIPKQGVISFNQISDNALPFALGNQFLQLEYSTRAYHNHTYTYYKRHKSHPNMGYEYKGVGNGLDIKESWPESDLEMIEATIPEYIDNDKFHVYYMTVSGHMNYTFIGNSMSSKNKSAVEHLPYSEEVKAYIACNIELDRALEKLIKELTNKGVLDKTVIALSSDHYPYGLEKDKLDEIAGHPVEENYELYKNHFILWSGSMKEPIIVDKPCSSLDIIPTLSNLFNLPYDSRLFMGKDILSDSEPLVVFSNRSFINHKVSYNSVTKEVIQRTEEKLPEDYIKNMNQVVKTKFQISTSILEEDYYKYILPYLE